MRSFRVIFLTIGLALLILAPACRPAATPEVASPATEPAPPAAEPTEAPVEEEEVDFERDLADFNPDNFDNPTQIDNEWFPLVPGTQYIYEGITEEAGIETPHRVIITVTDLTKVIDGVLSVVAWDEDYSDGELVETELAFYAQDNDGNVWRLGEYPEVWENGVFVEAPAWISGLKGARAGIFVLADPQLDGKSHSQGWGPAVGFTDRARVSEMGASTCVPIDCYEDVLVVEEFSQEEPDAFQLKYYASGVGNVQVGWSGLDATRETLELVEIVELTPEQMDAAREAALALEARAYEISLEVYDQTPPSEQSE